MRRAGKIALAFAALWVATAGLAVAASAPGGPAAVRLKIAASYDADKTVLDSGQVIEGAFTIDREPRLPLARLATRLLARAGTAVVDDVGDDISATLTIELHGTALGQVYDYMEHLQRWRRLRFAGARITGGVVFDTGTGRVCSAPFAGAIAPRGTLPVLSGRDYREDPAHAPFEDVLYLPGSFAAALAVVVGEVYGTGALEAAGGGAPQTPPSVDCREANARP